MIQDLKDAMQGQTDKSNLASSSMAADAAVMNSDSSMRNEDVSGGSGCHEESTAVQTQGQCQIDHAISAVGHLSHTLAHAEGMTT